MTLAKRFRRRGWRLVTTPTARDLLSAEDVVAYLQHENVKLVYASVPHTGWHPRGGQRDSARPEGTPDGRTPSHTHHGNEQARLTIALLGLALDAGAHVLLQHARTSVFWRLPFVATFLRRVRRVQVDLCAWGAASRGAVTWATSVPGLHQLGWRCPGLSAHHSHNSTASRVWDPVSRSVVAAGHLALDPPPRLAGALCGILEHTDDARDVDGTSPAAAFIPVPSRPTCATDLQTRTNM